MNASFKNDLNNLRTYYILLVSLTILWILFICLFVDIVLSKIIAFILSKYLNTTFKLNMSSISFSFVYFGVLIKNVTLCIENVCHIELAEIRIKFNRRSLWENSSRIVRNRIFYAQVRCMHIILVNENLSSVPKIDIFYLYSILNNFVF